MRVRHRLALVASAAIIAGATPAGPAPAAPAPPVAVAAKSCSAGYTHAVIGGEHKCLGRGQFCAKRHARQYTRYGFRCVGGRLR